MRRYRIFYSDDTTYENSGEKSCLEGFPTKLDTIQSAEKTEAS